MALFNLTITDEEEGLVKITTTFDPDPPESVLDATPAQIQGMLILSEIVSTASTVEPLNAATADAITALRPEHDVARFEDDGGPVPDDGSDSVQDGLS